MKRPFLFTLIALFAIISGAIALLGGLGIETVAVIAGIKKGETTPTIALQIAAAIPIIGGILNIAYGMGIWKLKSWAWWIALFSNILLFINQIANSPDKTNPTNYYIHWVCAGIYGFIILYFFSKKVRTAFGISRP